MQVLAYLNAFAEEYDLKRHISFNTSVRGMQPVSSTQTGDCFLLPPSNPLCWGSSLAMIIRSTNVHACHHNSSACHFASVWHMFSILKKMPTTQQQRASHAWHASNRTAVCTVMRYEVLTVDVCVVYTDGHQECGDRWSVTTLTSGQVQVTKRL